MKDKTKIYIDLSKCAEEERKHIFSLLPECCGNGQYVYNDRFAKHLIYNSYHQSWVTGLYSNDKRLKELTYPEFIKLFEGGEGENNTYSFSYLSCGKTLTVHIEAKNFNKAMIEFATNYHDIEWLYHAKIL